MKLHAKFGSPGPYALGQGNIKSFHYINLHCQTCDPILSPWPISFQGLMIVIVKEYNLLSLVTIIVMCESSQ